MITFAKSKVTRSKWPCLRMGFTFCAYLRCLLRSVSLLRWMGVGVTYGVPLTLSTLSWVSSKPIYPSVSPAKIPDVRTRASMSNQSKMFVGGDISYSPTRFSSLLDGVVLRLKRREPCWRATERKAAIRRDKAALACLEMTTIRRGEEQREVETEPVEDPTYIFAKGGKWRRK